MNKDFEISAAERADKDFALARIVWERLRDEEPRQSLALVQTLLGPVFEPLGTMGKLEKVLHALDPDTPNVAGPNRLFAFVREEFRDVAPSLRARVFPKPKCYEETGSESNRQLARILNKLAGPPPDPIDAMKRPLTGDKVLHLPSDPTVESEKKHAAHCESEALACKQRAGGLFVREVQELLFGERSFTSHSLQGALHAMHDSLEGGAEVNKVASDVINDFGQIGKIMQVGATLSEAVAIRKKASASKVSKTPNSGEPQAPTV